MKEGSRFTITGALGRKQLDHAEQATADADRKPDGPKQQCLRTNAAEHPQQHRNAQSRRQPGAGRGGADGAHDVAPRASDGSLELWDDLYLTQPGEPIAPDLSNIDNVVEAARRGLHL